MSPRALSSPLHAAACWSRSSLRPRPTRFRPRGSTHLPFLRYLGNLNFPVGYAQAWRKYALHGRIRPQDGPLVLVLVSVPLAGGVTATPASSPPSSTGSTARPLLSLAQGHVCAPSKVARSIWSARGLADGRCAKGLRGPPVRVRVGRGGSGGGGRTSMSLSLDTGLPSQASVTSHYGFGFFLMLGIDYFNGESVPDVVSKGRDWKFWVEPHLVNAPEVTKPWLAEVTRTLLRWNGIDGPSGNCFGAPYAMNLLTEDWLHQEKPKSIMRRY
ncbi:uncharacterized protein BXZ73DRAFT_79563 [Epithele typhae]|uniref:uncharacterized protein n=1 Tax=Epithele typhae TaxID=378194 RepID=UPI002008B131|nr:uncharacterized protein BXZ73DRAFT_79563 [Epithele typhae]KAH9923147.1 hypothetical protein BXZ73DRAFT_79563 [Epithele typhae]